MRKDFKKDRPYNRDGKFKKSNFKRHRREEFFVPGNGLAVKVPDSNIGTLEKALKYLKRQLKDDDTMMRLRAKRYYEKPTAKRKRVKEAAYRAQWTLDRQAERANKGHVWTAIMDGKAS